MRTVGPIAKAAFAAGLVAAALGLGLRHYMKRPAQYRLLPGEEAAIAELRSPLPQPSFLACPPGYCGAGEAVASPIFEMSWAQLRDGWRRIVAAEPGVVEVAADGQRRRSVYIAHSAMFGFPDIVTVEFVALDPFRSGIALYSRSRYGRSDFGANRRRVEGWLARLQQEARAQPHGRGGSR